VKQAGLIVVQDETRFPVLTTENKSFAANSLISRSGMNIALPPLAREVFLTVIN
jgi:hypothetical protein